MPITLYDITVKFERTESGFFVRADIPDNNQYRDHFKVGSGKDIEAMTTALKKMLDDELKDVESRKNNQDDA